MSKEIAIKEEVSFDIMANLDSVTALTKKLMQTKHYAKIGEEGLFAICMTADSIGMPRLEALQGSLYYVQGRVGMSYEAMNKYIRMAGHSVTIKHLDDKSCTLIGKRKDTGDTAEITYTMDDARKAGKSYDKHPKTMLFARCLSMLKRFVFPDVCTKVYVKEELDDMEPITDVDVEVVEKELPCVYATDDQIIDLLALLQKCPKDYSEKVITFLNGKGLSENKLPVDLFTQAIEGASKKAQEYLKSVSEGEIEEN